MAYAAQGLGKSGVVPYVRGPRVGAEVLPDVAQQRVRQRHHALSEARELRPLATTQHRSVA